MNKLLHTRWKMFCDIAFAAHRSKCILTNVPMMSASNTMKNPLVKKHLCNFNRKSMFILSNDTGFGNVCSQLVAATCFKHTIDYSLVPIIREEDLQEDFVRGSGPGGQAVNKTANCVVLIHIPTGICVKCHHSRLLHQNRQLARKILQQRLDEYYNGDMSLSSQQKRIEERKYKVKKQKAKKLQELKKQFKEREGLD
ncbi:probable peptide chain release factor C12orf65, mitochondrial isoform X2 [Limulus polyphemus]|uniref:Probable peptide chain release factor C12orf65, mitochondrial isoform X2 n=1 Tax=Limulus polyphemus TaxID=6850 RepID=A0ABM1BGZ1_LIMPO|nr:probable peptide chain release factor C12orf65, mitochondrial isoform X2 [Limulus polyphemus]